MNSGWVNSVQNLRCQAVTQAGQYDGLWLAEARMQFHIFIHPTAVHRSHSMHMIQYFTDISLPRTLDISMISGLYLRPPRLKRTHGIMTFLDGRSTSSGAGMKKKGDGSRLLGSFARGADQADQQITRASPANREYIQ